MKILNQNLRKYGVQPYKAVVVHGGPGAPGGMKPVARELSALCGVLETLHSADSIDGQIVELKTAIEANTTSPIILIGHSWGAWLSYYFAARYPRLVKKLILVGSGSFEEKYLSAMNNHRESRLREEENIRVEKLAKIINDPNAENRNSALSEFGKLMSKADSFAPICLEDEALDFQPNVFQSCMNEINHLRRSGKLLEIGKNIECPVIAIHGEDDSHSFQGVKEPLTKVIKDFRFILLEKCGHTPWNEIYAKDKFYEILREELD